MSIKSKICRFAISNQQKDRLPFQLPKQDFVWKCHGPNVFPNKMHEWTFPVHSYMAMSVSEPSGFETPSDISEMCTMSALPPTRIYPDGSREWSAISTFINAPIATGHVHRNVYGWTPLALYVARLANAALQYVRHTSIGAVVATVFGQSCFTSNLISVCDFLRVSVGIDRIWDRA